MLDIAAFINYNDRKEGNKKFVNCSQIKKRHGTWKSIETDCFSGAGDGDADRLHVSGEREGGSLWAFGLYGSLQCIVYINVHKIEHFYVSDVSLGSGDTGVCVSIKWNIYCMGRKCFYRRILYSITYRFVKCGICGCRILYVQRLRQLLGKDSGVIFGR